jgi:hypothetical protein
MVNYTLWHSKDSDVRSCSWRVAREEVPLVERKRCDVTLQEVSCEQARTRAVTQLQIM